MILLWTSAHRHTQNVAVILRCQPCGEMIFHTEGGKEMVFSIWYYRVSLLSNWLWLSSLFAHCRRRHCDAHTKWCIRLSTIYSTVQCKTFGNEGTMDNYPFYHESDLPGINTQLHHEHVGAQIGRNSPTSGPKHVTKTPLPTICQPNAAGNVSSEQYSDTVSVKLLSAMPRKNPQMNSQSITWLYSVCSAMTANREKQFLFMPNVSYWNAFDDLLDRVTPTNRIETKKIRRFFTWNRSQIGGRMMRAAISEMAVTDRQ